MSRASRQALSFESTTPVNCWSDGCSSVTEEAHLRAFFLCFFFAPATPVPSPIASTTTRRTIPARLREAIADRLTPTGVRRPLGTVRVDLDFALAVGAHGGDPVCLELAECLRRRVPVGISGAD